MNANQPDVMGLVASEQGKGKRLPPQEIVKIDLDRQGMADQFEDVYARLESALQTANYRMMRSGNTLLFYRITKPKEEVEFDIITADSPRALPESMKDIMEAMKKAGFKRGVAKTENPALVKMAQAAGIPVQVKMGERMVGTQMLPTQMITVELQ